MIIRYVKTLKNLTQNMLASGITFKMKVKIHLNTVEQSNIMSRKYISKNSFAVLNCAYKMSSSKLSKQQIQKSSYQSLIEKIALQYNFQQYKIPSTLALLEIHHQYKIFKPGDWVLDIGAGPNWSWTDLALKLTHTSKNSNKVISNDLHQPQIIKNKQNNIIVTGNFNQQPTQTKIAMNLIQKQLNVILIDATSKFTGSQQRDSQYTMNVFVKVLEFAQRYLKKGGTIVFRTIQSSSTLRNQEQAKFFFNQVYRYKSNAFRINSPSFFYVMKGYMMNDNLKGLENCLRQYQKCQNSYSKTQVVEKYRKLYHWDPVGIIQNKAKQIAINLKKQGKKNSEIAKLYQNDPYVKIGQILQLIDKIQSKQTNIAQKIKAQNKFSSINDKKVQGLPANQQQFAQMVFKGAQEMQKEEAQEKNKRKMKKDKKLKMQQKQHQNIKQKAPLGQSQFYMKSGKITQQKELQNQSYREYRQQDLHGFNQLDPHKSINKIIPKTQQQMENQNEIQLHKIINSFPEVKKMLQENQNGQDINKKFEKQFSKMFSKPEQNEQQDQKQQLVQKQKKKRKQNLFENDGHQQQLNQFSFKSKSEIYSDKKSRDRQKQIQSQQNYNNQDEVFQKINKRHGARVQDEQYTNLTKTQYLHSKPKKTDRPNYNKPKKSTSYFKQKKKDK